VERTTGACADPPRREAGRPPLTHLAALVAVAALAALAYAWAIGQDPLETYYAAAVRSMSTSGRDFFFGAVDPSGTITLDKLPGAFWIQALSVRVFGFRTWAIIAPQVVEGVLTVLVLYRAVARLATPGAGLIAALVLAASPATVALDRGNISDTLLVLLLVLAADATSRAIATGRLRSLFLAALWVGLAFQAKMIEAWLLLPALGLAYLLFGPGGTARRVRQLVAAGIVTAAVSLAWMTAVTLTPGSDRPYVDGSHHNSIYQQVFVYNGFGRFGDQTPLQLLAHQSLGINLVQTPAAAWNRLLQGDLGRDTAWLLPAALLIAVWGLVAGRHRACFVLWGVWLITLTVVFSLTATLNAYYTAALSPAIGAIIGAGLAALWADRRALRHRRIGAAVVVAGTVIYAVWLVPGTGTDKPGWLVPSALALGAVATALLLASYGASRRDAMWAAALVGGAAASLWVPAVASAELAAHHQGAFATPFQSAAEAAAITNLFVTIPTQVKSTIPQLVAGERGAPYLMATETSALAAVFIYDSGQEALPIGGFTGTIPSPTLAQLQGDIRAEKFHLVLAAKSRDPRLVWIADHCLVLPAPTPALNAYYCLATDASASG
jgi:4-amino-4-deoxy-L-arabinose transferase-like glycosyltransferase